MSQKIQTVTKLEAAHRQINEAIHLWFEERDDIAILTLAASGHQIIHDLNTHGGGEDLLFDNLNIKDEYRSQWISRLKQPWNFFKHADKASERNPSAQLEFSVDHVIEFFLFSTKGLRQLGRTPSRMEFLFLLWLGLHQPEWLVSVQRFRADFDLDEQSEESLRSLSRAEFFRTFYTPNFIK